MCNPSLMLILKFKETPLTEKVDVKADDGTTSAFALKQHSGSSDVFVSWNLQGAEFLTEARQGL